MAAEIGVLGVLPTLRHQAVKCSAGRKRLFKKFLGGIMRYLSALLFLFLLLGIAGGQAPITIYLAGDSTMAEKLPEKHPETGWGEFLQKFFNEDKVKVKNHAKNGRSTRTLIEEKLWQGIIEKLKEGDYVFVQFGHNDESKEKVDRYTSPIDYRQ